MSDPPVKTKRAGDLVATSPNCSELADHTPLICSAQEECSPEETRIEILPPGSVHFGKEICRNCDRVLRFLPKPQTIERQHMNAFRIAKLTMCNGLTSWQRKFVSDIAALKKLSPARQQLYLDKIYTEHFARAAR
jgi:hypothetical protein